MKKVNWIGCLGLLSVLLSPLAMAQDGMSALTVKTMADGSQEYSLTLQVLALMTALSFLPAIVIMMTSFTRIIVVLSILRQAIGLQQSPSNQILVGMALFMSFFIMSPVLDRINSDALQPYMSEQITAKEALEKAEAPLRQFMLGQTRIKDLDVFSEIANVKADKPEDVPLRVLIPAFITSELKTRSGFVPCSAAMLDDRSIEPALTHCSDTTVCGTLYFFRMAWNAIHALRP